LVLLASFILTFYPVLVCCVCRRRGGGRPKSATAVSRLTYTRHKRRVIRAIMYWNEDLKNST